jgi:hypothetical protein
MAMNKIDGYGYLDEFPKYRIYTDSRIYSEYEEKMMEQHLRDGYYRVTLVAVINGEKQKQSQLIF